MRQDIINLLLLFVSNSNSILGKVNGLLLGIILSCSCYAVSAQGSRHITIKQSSIAQPITIKGISGGAIMAKEISQTENTATGYCDGYVSSQPNHVLKLESFWDLLRLEIVSQADTTILVKGSGGVWCNDDAGTPNPVIEGQWQPGLYEIWVGSYQANSENDYQIKITGRMKGLRPSYKP